MEVLMGLNQEINLKEPTVNLDISLLIAIRDVLLINPCISH